MIYKIIYLLLLFLLNNIFAYTQNLVINEVAPLNVSIIKDEDGDYEDWVELHNKDIGSLNLEGFALSDESSNLFKWIFPSFVLEPGEFLLVWASGKNRKSSSGQMQNGLISQFFYNIQGDRIEYLLSNPNFPDTPSEERIINDFFHSPTNIGDYYGQRIFGYLLAPLTGYYTFWISSDDNGSLRLSPDMNSFNAREIARVPSWTNPLEWEKYSEQKSIKIRLEAGKYYYIEALMKENIGGDNLAVRWQLPNNVVEEPIPASRIYRKINELHTNFSLKSSGENLFLTNPSGQIIDSVKTTVSEADVSFGRLSANTDSLVYFLEPTPGSANSENVFPGRSTTPLFSLREGFYNHSIEVSLSSPAHESRIYYTTDCSDPSEQSNLYTSPLSVDLTSTIRAKAFSSNLLPSRTATKSFFINEHNSFAAISVTTDPENLYNADFGIFVLTNPHEQSNLFQNWERPAHIEFFEPDGIHGFSLDAGIQVHGGLTRIYPYKSLSVMARSKYGQQSIDYNIFNNKDLSNFNSIVLRNSGNDVQNTMLRDCFMQNLLRNNMDLELSMFRPAVVYLNGNYWGIRNIQEKINRNFIASHTKLKPDSINILGYVPNNSSIVVIEGKVDNYKELIDYISLNDLSDSAAYNYISQNIDINNFIDYSVAQIFFDNTDWPGNNIKWWKSNEPGSKWRWLMYDTDFGFGLLYEFEVEDGELFFRNNTLELATEENGPDWPNPPHSTFLLRNLLKNLEFRNSFINTFCDHLNSTFLPERVNLLLEDFVKLYEPEIPRYYQLLSQSTEKWYNGISIITEFATNRPNYQFTHLMMKFKLSRQKSITISVSDTTMGMVRINSIICPAYPWSGKYFPEVPITLKATPFPNHKFTRWSDGNTSPTRKADVKTISNLTAFFEFSEFNPNNIVINEIKYISDEIADSKDWIELYNNSDVTADISNWIFKDAPSDHRFSFPAKILMQPSGFLVICRDTNSFKETHPEINNIIGNFDFGLSSTGESVELYNSKMDLIDFVNYGITAPWPEIPVNGSSIELTNPHSDNEIGSNWKASGENGGSPGRHNTSVIQSVSDVLKFGDKADLAQNYPNPFSTLTHISYRIAKKDMVTINIINLTGQVINTLVNQNHEPGLYQCSWDGTNFSGQHVPAGVYFYQLKTRDSLLMKKILFNP